MFKSIAKYCLLIIMISILVPSFVWSDEIKPRRLKFSMGVGPSSPWTQSAELFAKLVKERTGGKVKIKVYPSGQLSSGNQITEFDLLKSGTIDITYHSSIILSIVDQRFSLFSLPWIATDEKQLFRVIDGPGKKLWMVMEQQGIKPLGGFSSSGYRQLTNNVKSIRSPEDMEKMTFRVPGLKMYKAIFKQLGANPVPTSFGELYGALQQGVVDGQENPISLIEVAKFYEVQKYMSIWNYSADCIGIMMNKKLWESFSPKAKKILTDSAKEASAWHREAQGKEDQRALKKISKHMEIIKLTASEIGRFRKAMDPVYETFEEIIGSDLVRTAEAAAKEKK